MAQIGWHFAKRYTTAGYGGCDKYQVLVCVLCNGHRKKRGCYSHFLCQRYKTVSPHLPWNVWGTGNPFRLGATPLTFKWRWRSSYSSGGSPHVVGILMISLRGNKVGGRRWMRCGQNGRAGWSREFLRPLSSYSSLQLWRNYPQAQLGPLFVGDHGNFK